MAEDEDSENDQDTHIPSSFHIRFGSQQPQMSLEAIEEQHINNPSFRQFHTKLNAFLNTLPAITQLVNMLPLDKSYVPLFIFSLSPLLLPSFFGYALTFSRLS
ncbi:hypothetical protein BDR07DRAFT_1502290 [Suillus spraguei]|nr:hypothetical protein BDR07DRAFT_1502290 [Suillus spraguei]